MRFTDFISKDKVISESGFDNRFEYISNTFQTAIESMMDEQEFVGKANTKQIQKLNTLLTQTFEKWAQEFEKELNDIDRQESDEGEK
tara:strand:- start:154 stop:414 length:261 start_codon:yes stop_codon:yes gene_type:complete